MEDTVVSTMLPINTRIEYALRKGRQFVEDVEEAWKREHAQAQHCFDVQDLIVDVNRHFERLLEIDDQIRDKYAAGMEYEQTIHDSMAMLMRDWMNAAGRLPPLVAKLEKKGYDVDGAVALATNLAEARAMTSPDDAAADFTRLAEVRDRAVAEDRADDTMPWTAD